MLDIRKKITAVAVICAMAVSMAACSDKKDSDSSSSAVDDNNIKTASLSSEEKEQLKKVDLNISEFIPPTDAGQDPVEQDSQAGDSQSGNTAGGNASADNSAGGNTSGGSQGGNTADSQNANSGVDQSSLDPEKLIDDGGLVIVPGGEVDKTENSGDAGNSNNNQNNNQNADNNNNQNNNQNADNNNNQNNNQNADNNNNQNNNQNADNNNQNNNNENNNQNSNQGNNGQVSDAPVISGNKKIQQAIWLDLSGDFVFDGEFITATFKIKDNAQNGVYPITLDWLDFSNYDAVTVKATGIDGSVTVGGEAATNAFKNDGTFEVKADCVSGKPGDTVTVVIRFNKNPGICASVLRFGYDSDVLEYVSGAEGDDFLNALETQNQETQNN